MEEINTEETLTGWFVVLFGFISLGLVVWNGSHHSLAAYAAAAGLSLAGGVLHFSISYPFENKWQGARVFVYVLASLGAAFLCLANYFKWASLL